MDQYKFDNLVYGKIYQWDIVPDNKFHGANMGPTWVLSAPDGSHEPCYKGT